MKYILKTSKLSLNPEGDQNKSIIYTGSPNKDQKNKGKLIIMLDFPKNTGNVKELGNLLIQKIHKLYYESTLIDQESILENILEETNENLPTLTEVDKDWIKNFNALITIIYRQNVYFSPVGNISAWINSDNKIVNIFDYLDSNIDKASVDKIFTNILSGNIDPEQSLIFTTKSIFDYVAEEKIGTIMSENDPQGVVIKLKELLYKIKDKSFCLVSIKLSPFEQKQITESSININSLSNQITAKESIDKLLDIQQKTKNILIKGKTRVNKKDKSNNQAKAIKDEKNAKPTFENILKSAESVVNETTDQKTDTEIEKNDEKEEKIEKPEEREEISTSNTELESTGEEFIKVVEEEVRKQQNDNQETKNPIYKKPKIKKNKFSTKIFRNIVLIIIFPFIKIFELISKIKIKKNASKTALIHQKNNAPITVIKSNRKKSKLILIIGIIIFVIFGISLFITSRKKENLIENEKYNKIVSEINDKKMEYDLVNIYKDESLAKEKLKEISDLINSLPQKTKNQIEKYEEVLNSFSEILNKVNKLETITNPEIVVELSFNPKKIIKQGNNLLLFGTNSNEIAKVDINSKQNTSQEKDNIYNGINLYGKDENYVYGIDTKDLIKINLDNFEISKLPIAYHPNYKSAQAIEFYANNLYIVDSSSNQIYKHNGNKGNFEKGVEWIKDKTDVSSVLSIAIDTNIYLGKSDGSIVKMFAGKVVAMEIKDVDPKIQSQNKIYTDKSIDQIYILDSSNKRFIIINKKGELLKQYYLPTLKEINDFTVDGASKKIYLISENKIISLNISF